MICSTTFQRQIVINGSDKQYFHAFSKEILTSRKGARSNDNVVTLAKLDVSFDSKFYSLVSFVQIPPTYLSRHMYFRLLNITETFDNKYFILTRYIVTYYFVVLDLK